MYEGYVRSVFFSGIIVHKSCICKIRVVHLHQLITSVNPHTLLVKPYPIPKVKTTLVSNPLNSSVI